MRGGLIMKILKLKALLFIFSVLIFSFLAAGWLIIKDIGGGTKGGLIMMILFFLVSFKIIRWYSEKNKVNYVIKEDYLNILLFIIIIIFVIFGIYYMINIYTLNYNIPVNNISSFKEKKISLEFTVQNLIRIGFIILLAEIMIYNVIYIYRKKDKDIWRQTKTIVFFSIKLCLILVFSYCLLLICLSLLSAIIFGVGPW